MMITIEVEKHPVLDDVAFQHFLKECGLSIMVDRHRTQSVIHEWVFERYTNVLPAYREQIELEMLNAMNNITALGVGEALHYISRTTEITQVVFNQGQLKVEYY